jgi:DNA helicase-2/ATP-dependent DNA helicase PcrA
VFAAYLFELSQWPRALLHDDSPEGARARATLGQVTDLLRGFRGRGGVADGEGAAEFLRYVALAIESGRLETGTTTSPPRRPDAVNVLTMHGSKGLQWPVVFVPHQVEDTWKPSNEGDLPLPGFLPRDKDPLDSDEFEEACLLYVALTRAQNRLFVSSARQGRFVGGREVRPHPLIAGVRQALEASSGTIEFIEVGDRCCSAESVAPAGGHGQTTVYAPYRFEDAVPHRLLEMYAGCGLKFLFHYVYRLDDGENRFRVFGKVVHRAMQRIAGAVAQGTVPSDQEVERMFGLLWEKATGGAQDAGSLYVARGLQALQAFRDRLRPGEPVTIGYEATFLVEGRLVSLRIDELCNDGSRWVVRKHHLSKPSTRHGKDKFFLGLQLANRQNNLRAPRTVLDYPLERKEEFVATPYGDRVAAHQNDITAAIAAIESGEFPPAPSAFKCRNCAFNLVCPAS